MTSRVHFAFECAGATLVGTCDTAPGSHGLLIVTGGNEIRSGAFSGQARLAARLAGAGFPVFRFDRRGIGDSGGDNAGFRAAGPDIAAALAAFRTAAPQVVRVTGFGNCDAASALMLAAGAGCDGLVLSNPWTLDDEPDEAAGEVASPPPAAAIRRRYVEKLRNPREMLRLLRGEVDFAKLAKGLTRMARKPVASTLAAEMKAGLARFDGPVRILLAERDRTAQLFMQQWGGGDTRLAHCAGASHAYVEAEASAWLERQLIEALRG